ncbi:MAG: bi-domain-containing oxidoreductase [Anaerolineaceae bacterium]|nr:bi-domain-containing oxidoreductase [Anaerolineaceae bacterium]
MKQLLQNMRDGKTAVVDIPDPLPRPGTALVRTAASLVSAGTERMVVEFAEKNLVGKAQSRPDLVRQVLDKARREGILPTIQAAFNRLEQPMSLGYSSAGTIVALGEGVQGFEVGDRVACAGAGYAVHAELAVVPRNLMFKLPENVDFESASFATLGAIALQGFRLAQPQVQERVAIIGLGLLGLLSTGIARAAGCEVFGIDLDPKRVALGEEFGATACLRKDAEAAGLAFTRGRGFDVVLICADTKSNDPVELAGNLAREHGQVVAIGAVGMDIPRKVYYTKELSFHVSRSYGPGRYDPAYEEKGQDYPFGYVRWTEGRNIEAIITMLASGGLNVAPLISHHYDILDAPSAYDLITGKIDEPFLGIVLTYPEKDKQKATVKVYPNERDPKSAPAATTGAGILGAGNYAKATFLPAVKRVGGIPLVGIASASGLNANHAAGKFGFQYATASEEEILNDSNISHVAILTRHNDHARQTITALKNGKHVYCEKPLALNAAELDEIETALQMKNAPLLMVGFNRRFAPLAIKMKKFIAASNEPLAMHYRVNAGFLPDTHWLHDPEVGGGRIIGEGCHFIDFLSFLVGAPPLSISAKALPDAGRYHQDNVILTLTYPDGSIGTISYLANGDKTVAKEQVDVFSGGRVAVLNDFRQLEMTCAGRRSVLRSRFKQDKGHGASWQAFLSATRGNDPAPIPYRELWAVTLASFAALESLKSGNTVKL